MFINHSGRTIALRIVYCGAPGTTVLPTLENIVERSPTATEMRTGWAGARHVASTDFAPEGLGAIHGYGVRILLLGFESSTWDGAPCDMSGFRDVDGVVFVTHARTPAHDVSRAFEQLRGSLEHIGYDFTKFPWVVQAEEGVDVAALRQVVPIGDRPCIAATPATGEGVFEALKAVTRAVLVALKNNQLHEPAVHGPS